jgi:cytochrome oxidase assembly protein ShyY1
VYRFLLSVRWIGAILLTIVAALVMVRLGIWQLHRYEERSAINARIDAADAGKAVPMSSVMAAPSSAGKAGASPGNRLAWTKVTVSGVYDPTHEIQARDRTVNGDVGFEIVTPLKLTDGTAVLVDRGWVPSPDSGATAAPVVPPAPSGQITVIGQLHLSESRPTPIGHRDGRLDTRRISVGKIASQMPYPVYGAYILLNEQTPANSSAFSQIPIDKEDDWQNAGYTVQWWLFAGMTLFAFGWQARKEAQIRAGIIPDPKKQAADRDARTSLPIGVASDPSDRVAEDSAAGSPGPVPAGRPAPRADAPIDRVEEADRKRAARKAPADRVEEADRKLAAEAERKLAAQSGQD